MASAIAAGLVAAGAVGHAVGGWYFSDAIIADAFVPAGSPLRYDITIVATDGGSVTLAGVDGAADPARGAVMGFQVGDSFLSLGPGTLNPDGTVLRPFSVLAGTVPPAGAVGALDSAAFPDAGSAGVSTRPAAYETPLGPMDAWEVDGDDRRWVIHVHGKGVTTREAIRLLRPLAAAGYHQLAISYRNDPGEPSDPSGLYQYGHTEWEDLSGAISYAVDHGASEVILAGYSTGGAIISSYLLRTSGGPVVAAVLDSPNLDMAETVALHASRRSLPFGIPIPPTLTAVARAFASLRIGVNWKTIDYTSRAERIRVPVLVVHGTADDWVPVETSRRFAEANPDEVTLVEFPGAGHVESWNSDPARYEGVVLDFIAAALP